MVLCLGVGVWALRRTRSASDFFVAGRNLGVMVTAFAVFSSTMSGFGFVGGPGLVYKMGMSSIWIVVSSVIGGTVGFYLLAKRLRLLSELGNAVSLPDIVGMRYNSNTTRFLISVAIILGVLGYLATQILAMAIVLRDILVEMEIVANFSLESAMLISGSILLFYSVTGGIIASVYTDLIQGSIMIVAAILIFITVHNQFEGGFTEMSQIIIQDDPGAMSPWGTLGMVGSMSWFFVFAVGMAGQPHVITKFMMMKRVQDIRHILPLSIFGYMFTALLWIGIGLGMRALVISGVHPELSSPDSAASQFLQHYANPVLAGIVFAGLFAAIMSTADAFLNIGTAAVMHDIPNSLGIKVKNELATARITTILLTLIAGFFALYIGDLVAILGIFGWGTFAAAIVPVIGIGVNWKRATAKAANVSIILSLSINFLLKIFNVPIPYGIDIGAIALAVSLASFISISLLSKPVKIDPRVEKTMEI